jgi:hypothetical protein
MPSFPQYPNAVLVEAANYRQLTQGTHVAAGAVAVAANAGDIINNVVAAGDASTYTVTLPPAALGGPVLVKVSGQFGCVSNSVVIIPQVADTVAGTKIEGFGSIKLIQPLTAAGTGTSVLLASDGTQWWIISRAFNTTDTW